MTTTEPIISKELNDKIEEFAALWDEISAKDGIGDWESDRKRLEQLLASMTGLTDRQAHGDQKANDHRMLRNQIIDGCVSRFHGLIAMLDNAVVMQMIKTTGIAETVRRLTPTRQES